MGYTYQYIENRPRGYVHRLVDIIGSISRTQTQLQVTELHLFFLLALSTSSCNAVKRR